MRRATRLAWRRALRALREECHPLLPVRVRLAPGPSRHFGLAAISRDAAAFNLTVYRSIREEDGTVRPATRCELLDSLVHEWAHCVSWPGVTEEYALERHDAAWGVAYARCYNAVVED